MFLSSLARSKFLYAQMGRELFPYDPEIERTLWRARRGRVIIKNQLERGIDGLSQNMGNATGVRRE